MVPWLAALAALGVRALTTQVLYGAHALVAVTLGWFVFLPLSPPLVETATGYAVATAFACASAGRRGAAAAVAVFCVIGLDARDSGQHRERS